MHPYKYIFKFIIVGNSGTGKSCITTRYVSNKYTDYSDSTIGVEFGHKIINVNNIDVKILIWDTAGQERYQSIAQSYYRGTTAVVLVYDVNNRETFNRIPHWYETVKENHEPIDEGLVPIILVGNKIDLNRKVSYVEAYELAKKLGIEYMEVSAKNNIQINQLFKSLAVEICSKIEIGLINPDNNNVGIKRNSPPDFKNIDFKKYDNLNNNKCC